MVKMDGVLSLSAYINLLCFCGLFNDAFSVAQVIASNERAINKRELKRMCK
jgi:hypothetical protein